MCVCPISTLKDDSRNLRGSPYAGKQCQWGDERVWWFVVLAHGKVAVQVMPRGWVQNGAGQAEMVKSLPGIVAKMCKNTGVKPTIACTDRGPGFFHARTGDICPEYAAALEQHGLKPWAGENALHQPADIPDVLLHETAVAWIRSYLRHHPVRIGANMDTNRANLVEALKSAAQYCNDWYDVEGLCHAFPKRMKQLVEREGGRLSH